MKLPQKILFTLLVVIAFIFRLSIMLFAYHGDLNNNISWGKIANQIGYNNFYNDPNSDNWPYSAPNQPPLTILLFSTVLKPYEQIKESLWDLNYKFSFFPSKVVWLWEEKGNTILIKLPSIIADVLIGVLIYKYLAKNGNKNAVLAAFIWLFNPLTWYNSSIWGQTDSIVNLLGLLSLIALTDRKFVRFSFWFTLSFLYKASLGVFIPLIAFIVISQRHNLSTWVKSLLTVISTTALISVWFHPSLDLFFWIAGLYKERIIPGEIGYLTAGAFNFWWLIDSGKTLDSVKYLILDARTWGAIYALGFISISVYFLKNKLSQKNIWMCLAFSALCAFLFMTRIHPRYLYPFFPAATIYLAYNKRFLPVYLLLSTTHLLNIYYQFWAPDFINLKPLFYSNIFPNILALFNLVAFFYMLRHIQKANI